MIAAVVLVAAAFALARHHGPQPFGGALAPGKTSRAALPEPAAQTAAASADADAPFLPIEVKSDWDRMRLRTPVGPRFTPREPPEDLPGYVSTPTAPRGRGRDAR